MSWPLFERGIVHVTKRKKEIDAMIEKILSGKFVKDHCHVPPVGFTDPSSSAKEAIAPTAGLFSVPKKSKKPSVQTDVQSSVSDTSEDGDLFHSDNDGDDNKTVSSKSSIPSDADKTSTEA